MGAAALGSLPEPSPPPAPPGSVEVRFRRLESFPGSAISAAATLVFTSYFFIGPLGGLAWLALSPRALGALSWRTLWGIAAAYWLQLLLYKPQLSRGWPFKWFLYGPLVDYVLCYHDATCIREGPPLDPEGKYLFAVFPHGVYGVCRIFSGGVRLWRALYPGISARWGSFSAAFYLPGVREFSLMCGGCIDASRPVLERAIHRGENVMLLPGGIDEMNLTDWRSNDTKLVLLDRKGFVKLAIEHGMDIVPSFCFGEKYIHRTVQLPRFVRAFLRPFRLSGTLLKGRGPTFMGFLDPPLGYVWGTPIRVKAQKPVEPAYLDEVHGQVVEAVKGIFERHKARFGYSDAETLTVVSAVDAKAAIRSGGDKKVA